jgi:outer membrane protein assembly factor BamA
MRFVALLLVSSISTAALADDVPSFARNKPLAGEHVEGNHIEALPAIGYDPNVGVLLGAIGYYAMDGTKKDPLFAVTPYRHRVYAQTVFSTLGFQQHVLSYDGIYLRDSPYRLRAALMFERNINANYFGVGEAAMAPLEVKDASSPYNHYEYDKPSGRVTLERDLLGGLLRLEYGLVMQYVAVSNYGALTKLGMDCAAGTLRGCGGGWNNVLKAGIAFDTRDFEPDPNEGIFADAVAEWSSKGFGSLSDYVRFTTTARFYWSPFPKLADLVLASRFVYSMQTANAPFWAQGTLAGTDRNIDGALGGDLTLRGYRNNRFSGPVMALANAELRWTFWKFRLLKQHFGLQLAPFIDVGRVFDKVNFSLSDWHPAYGGALRIAWNHSTVLRFDIAGSREETAVYFVIDQPF